MPEILDDFVYHMYGQIEVGAGNWLGCGACKVREGQGTDIVDGHDWLVFYIPTGMLELKFDVRYVPWLQPGPWVDIVDSSLVRVANHIYQQLPFDLAFVGEEMSGEGNTSYVSRKTAEFGGVLFSPDLANRLAPDVPCTVLDSGLRWYPPSWDTSVGFES